HRMVALWPVGSRIFTEGSFLFPHLGKNLTFQHDFRMGWHFQVQGAAAHELYRLAHDSTRYGKFICLQGSEGKTADIESGVMSDRHRHRRGPILSFVRLPDVMTVGSLSKLDAVSGLGVKHDAINTGIANSIIGIA